jgi:Nucleotidyl transferase AbiEii toxin, Type IV TA system
VDNPSSDFEELFAWFNAKHVRAVVVGGHALAFHGHPRFTKDLDVFVDFSPENAQRILEALQDFGFGSVGLTAEDFSSPGRIVQLGVAPNRIDLMTAIDGVSFEEAWAGRVAGHFGKQPVAYIGRTEFLRNKRAAGRPQDIADIAALE